MSILPLDMGWKASESGPVELENDPVSESTKRQETKVPEIELNFYIHKMINFKEFQE